MAKAGRAGYSAYRRARSLQQKHAREALIWAAWSAGGGVVVVSLVFRSLSVGSLAAGAVIGVLVAVRLYRRPSEASRWRQGADAERRTGKTLARLKPLGWGVLHDLRIPGSRANIDHVVIHPSGLFAVMIDTKAWHVKGAKIRWDGQRLMYGRWNKTDQMETVRWEAGRLTEETGLTVVPVIACDRGNVVDQTGSSGVINVDGFYVLGSDNLFPALYHMDQLTGADPRRVRRAKGAIERRFAAAQ